MHPVASLLGVSRPVKIVDIGANPIDGKPPYKAMLETGPAELVGFEPQEDALARLKEAQGPHETYLPYIIGNGDTVTFHEARAPGMSSTLRPNSNLLNYFHGFPQWSEIIDKKESVSIRLDDIEETQGLDYLKMDVQGGERAVLEGAGNRLNEAVVIQTEVSFLPVYEDEPMFPEIDQMLRDNGYLPHMIANLNRRTFVPAVVGNSIYKGLNQLFQADFVYVKDFRTFARLPSDKLLATALIAHVCYGSADLAQLAIKTHDQIFGTSLWQPYMALAGLQALHS